MTSACLLALGMFLATSVWPKLRDLRRFVDALEGYGIPSAWAGVLAPILASVEAAVAGACLLRFEPRWTAAAVLGLLGVYSGVIAFALMSGRRGIGCGCFAFGSDRMVSWNLLLRNGVAAALAVPPLIMPEALVPGTWWLLALPASVVFLFVLGVTDELGYIADLIRGE